MKRHDNLSATRRTKRAELLILCARIDFTP